MLVCFLLLALAVQLSAQEAIAVRRIGPIVATSTEEVGVAPSLRVTNTGAVIVGSNPRRRVAVFDTMLQRVIVIRDSLQGMSAQGASNGLIPYPGDSALVPDLDGAVLLLLDPAGKPTHSIA